jgi:hypothetical protein
MPSPCLLQIISVTVIADEMHGIALVTSLQGMHGEKMFPVPTLFIVEDAGALAQRTVLLEGGEERPSDELGFVGDAVKPFGQVGVGLEGKDAFFAGSHAGSPWSE